MPWLAFWRWNVGFVLVALVVNGNWFAHQNNHLPLFGVLFLVLWVPLLAAAALTGLMTLFFTPQPLSRWRNIFVPVFGVAVAAGCIFGWVLALRGLVFM